ncbi:MAG TPA: trypsin-like peptidase domain-containing protein, partial [Streptomyces sp.]|nr:trypsin-like peptidase domain-containing protein [Streptomyces sp.]
MEAVLGEPALVRICDLAGRPRGTGFLADELGTVITSHEAVDGLGRVIVNTREDRSHLAEADDITPLPEWDLALIRTDGLDVAPLVIGAERADATGLRVRLRTGHTAPPGPETWTDARLAGTATVTYTSTDRFHALEEVLELDLPEAAVAELPLSRRASGSPVLDAETGAVLAVLGTALHSRGRAAGFAVPLRTAGLLEPDGPLGTLLARNGATVPGYGLDLNLAGVLRLTAVSVGPAVERAREVRRVHRPEVADALRQFMESDASAVALVGSPGTGRTTELAALAARRSDEVAVAPTVWLRGADLRAEDGSVREAVGRALSESRCTPSADVAARLARDAKRPLVVLLDAPEEMPTRLARELRRWTAGTASWLRASGARMVIACGPEHWEQAGEFFPYTMLHEGAEPDSGAQGRHALPPCVRLGGLPSAQVARAHERYGLDEGALSEADAGHLPTMRILAEICGSLGGVVDYGSAAP